LLSSDVLKQRQSRSAFTAQRRAATSGLDPRQERVLQLQRDAGNGAVSRMLQAQQRVPVQRELSYRPSDLAPHMRALTGTYAKIVWALRDFHAASDAQLRITYAGVIKGLCDVWLKDHAGSWGKGKPKSSLFGAGRTDAQRTIVARHKKLSGDEDYLAKMRTGGFASMGRDTRLNVDQASRSLAGGQTAPGFGRGTDERAVEVIRKYKLTEAEIAAVRTFTVSDYTYINPAKAGSESWLRTNVLQSKDELFKRKFAPVPYAGDDPWSGKVGAAMMQEGKEHAAMLMQALLKLPAYNQVTYRGTRVTPDDFAARFSQGKEVQFSSFGSSAKLRSVAQTFADGGGDVSPPNDAVVSVVFVVEGKNGRDISNISASTKPEDEVLILPGSSFTVSNVVKASKGSVGKPDARAWYTVFLKQKNA
jgi:NAD:arginine ADP-ribosyltransferase